MKRLLMLLAAATLAYLGHFTWESGTDAEIIGDAVDQMASLGDDDATILSCDVMVQKFPYAYPTAGARSQLADLQPWLQQQESDSSALPLRDALLLDTTPWLGPAAVMGLALSLALWLVCMPRSRVRFLSVLLLLAALAASVLGQGLLDLTGSGADGDMLSLALTGIDRLAYTIFPWAATGALAAGFLLGLFPRRRKD